MNAEIDRKMLKEKQELINYILSEEPDYTMGGKKLIDYTDEDKMQISYNFFFKIKNWLMSKKTDKTKRIIEKKFQKHDFYIRQ